MSPSPHDRLAALLPTPRSLTSSPGVVIAPARIAVGIDASDPALADDAWRSARLVLGALDLERVDAAHPGVWLRLRVVPGHDAASSESFTVGIDQSGVDITAVAHRGLVWGLQSVAALLPAEIGRRRPPSDTVWDLAHCQIRDEPTLAWRGVLLDVARHFLPLPELRKHIESLSALRVNRLQLHLTDDQGWRIESRRHPALHEIGSWRPETQISHFDDPDQFDGTPHGGYYSLADLRELYGLSRDLGIDLVPEIELPGHTGALLAAYPHLGPPRTSGPGVVTTWGVNDAMVSPTPAVVAVLTDVLGEVLDAAPVCYVHVGGDETATGAWGLDPAARAHALTAHLHSTAEQFGWLMNEVRSYLESRGATAVTWDDSFAAGAMADAREGGRTGLPVVMAWRGDDVARRAARAGHDVVLAPIMPTYLDYAQSDGQAEPLAIGGPVTLDDVLAWTPAADWSEAERERLLGVQAQLWTEFVPTPRHLDYLLYPRVIAFAEIAWNGRAIDVDGRREAVLAQTVRLAARGIEYRPAEGPQPWQAGGTGRRRHRVPRPMSTVVEVHETAAAQGRTPSADEFRAAGP